MDIFQILSALCVSLCLSLYFTAFSNNQQKKRIEDLEGLVIEWSVRSDNLLKQNSELLKKLKIQEKFIVQVLDILSKKYPIQDLRPPLENEE